MDIPPNLSRQIQESLGEAGAAWLAGLPELVRQVADSWQLTLGEPFELSFNYVCRARQVDGTDAVFKIGPWGDEVTQEIRALRHYGGRGSCRLLEADESLGAMLLERVRPGTMLRELAAVDDDEATRIGARQMQRLWGSAAEVSSAGESAALPPLANWFRAFERHRSFYGGPGPFSERTLSYAEGVTRELFASVQAEVLLHADFHHDNLLTGEREPWLAIDPHGMIGDPGYEVGPFMLNPFTPDGPPKESQLLARRLDIFAEELTYDRERLRLWGIAHAVLSACWTAENNGDGWQNAIHAAEQLILS